MIDKHLVVHILISISFLKRSILLLGHLVKLDDEVTSVPTRVVQENRVELGFASQSRKRANTRERVRDTSIRITHSCVCLYATGV